MSRLSAVPWLPLVVSSLLFACGGGTEPAADEEPAAASAPASETRTYQGVGTIVELSEESLVLDHDAIPGFMEAMSMSYPVDDPSILEPLEEGMVVRFRVVVDEDGYLVDHIEPGGERQQN